MRSRHQLVARVPVRIGTVLEAAFQAVRKATGDPSLVGTCLVIIARHFIDTWKEQVKPPRTRSQKVRERDLGWCQVPGCSRIAAHAHHVELRSHGGSDDDSNLVGICAVHHLRGVHGGYLRVWGRAPDQLIWLLGGEVWTGFGRGG